MILIDKYWVFSDLAIEHIDSFAFLEGKFRSLIQFEIITGFTFALRRKYIYIKIHFQIVAIHT